MRAAAKGGRRGKGAEKEVVVRVKGRETLSTRNTNIAAKTQKKGEKEREKWVKNWDGWGGF